MSLTHRHLCPAHAVKVRANEDDAYRYWTMMMQRGVAAYVQCRWDAADIYLGAAYEIAVLRLQVENNTQFDSSQLLRPLEFMLNMYRAEGSEVKTRLLLQAASRAVKVLQGVARRDLADLLSKARENEACSLPLAGSMPFAAARAVYH